MDNPRRKDILDHVSGSNLNGHSPIQILATEFPLETGGFIDALAYDSSGRPVLLLAGPRSEESWIFSILDSVSWIERHQQILKERFPSADLAVDLPALVLLISAEFPQNFLYRMSSLKGIDIDLLQARWSELKGEKKLLLQPLLPLQQRSKNAASTIPSWILHPRTSKYFRTIVSKTSKFGPGLELVWGSKRLDLLYQSQLLALFVPHPKGIRAVIPGSSRIDALVEDESGLMRTLDVIYRKFLSLSMSTSFEEETDEKLWDKQESLPSPPPSMEGVLSEAELEILSS